MNILSLAIRGMAVALALIALPAGASAVTKAEDIATTIMLRGQPCGGNAVTDISEQKDAAGNTVILATCPNGKRYQVDVSSSGRVSVKPIP